MEYVFPGAAYTFDFQASTGLEGTAGVSIVRSDGVGVTPRTGAGIVEAPAGSGNYLVTVSAPGSPGRYAAVVDDGAAVPNHVAAVTFEVVEVSVLVPPPPGGSLPGPVLGPCTSWITGTDVLGCCGLTGVEAPALDMVAVEASMALYEISGRIFTGLCDRTVRPCRDRCGCWGSSSAPMWAWDGSAPSWGWFDERGGRCGCEVLEQVKLSGYPVREITEVKIDGAVVDPGTYRLDEWRFLTRLDDPGPPVVKRYWPGCFPAGTLVLTDRGLVPIETVSTRDRVLTHRNRWRRVLDAGLTRHSETVAVSGRGGTLRCTPDHRIYVGGRGEASAWMPAWETLGHSWATPAAVEVLPAPLPLGWTRDMLPENFWWLVGRWVGDGWTDSAGRVNLCSGLHERTHVSEALRRTGWEWRESGGTKDPAHANARWRFQSPELVAWLRQHFGTSAETKRVPAWLLGADESVRRAFLDGYVSADGWRGKASSGRGRPYTSIHTVSRELAVGIRMLTATLGHAAMVYEGHATSSDHATYKTNWPEANPGGPYSQAWRDDDHIYGRVRSIVLDEEIVPVYDITVEEDESFVAEGVVVHNCQNLALEDGPGTFVVSYRCGVDPPQLGRDAAAEVACQLYRACNPGQKCALPAGVTRVQRHGVEIERGLLANWLDPKKPTGLVHVDLFLKAYGGRGRRRAAIYSPELQEYARPL